MFDRKFEAKLPVRFSRLTQQRYRVFYRTDTLKIESNVGSY